MGRKAENLVSGMLGEQVRKQNYEQKQEYEQVYEQEYGVGHKPEQEHESVCESEQEHESAYMVGYEQEYKTAHKAKQEYEHVPLKRDRELKTKRVNLLLPPSLAAWFKETAYSEGLSLNDAAIEAFKLWGQSVGKAYDGSKR